MEAAAKKAHPQPTPFFVVRNSRRRPPSSDRAREEEESTAASGAGGATSDADLDPDDPDRGDSDGDENGEQRRPRTSVASKVRLYESPRGTYRLDFDGSSESSSFVDDFLAEHRVREGEGGGNGRSGDGGDGGAGDDETYYVDGRAWDSLRAYASLIGSSSLDEIEKEGGETRRELRLTASDGRNEARREGSFVLLEESLVEIVHSLLPLEALFGWSVLVDARNRGAVRWKDVRAFLREVRENVPFLTRDGVLRGIVNTHLTFRQFCAFKILAEERVTSHVDEVPDEEVPDVKIYDAFPAFDGMDPEERRIELLASVKDKAVRVEADASGIAVPSSSTDEDVETEEWKRYVAWWSNSDDVRNEFCTRELLCAERTPEVRRNAEKDGISMRGRHSKDPLRREGFLRRFAAWYLGSSKAEDEDADEAAEGKASERDRAVASLVTYDFACGQNRADPIDLARASPLKLPGFGNRAWKPSAATERGDGKLDESEDEPAAEFMLIRSVASTPDVAVADSPLLQPLEEDPVLSNAPEEEERSSERQPIASDETTLPTVTFGNIAATFVVGSKLKPRRKKKSSFRNDFLRRLTSSIDTVASMVHRKVDGPKLRGVELFRSKVRLLIVLRRFLPSISANLEAAAPQNVDIFRFDAAPTPAAKVAPAKPEPAPAEPKRPRYDGAAAKALAERSRARRERASKAAAFESLASWRRRRLQEKREKTEAEEAERREREREKEMRRKAAEAYERSLSARCFAAMRDRAVRRREERAAEAERAKAAAAEAIPEEAEEPEEAAAEDFAFVPSAAPPGERDRMANEDVRSLRFRSHCLKWFRLDAPSLLDEVRRTELPARRTRPTGLDVACEDEYDRRFRDAIELRENVPPSANLARGRIALLDAATLRKMKREKLAGKSNLFDVPREFTDVPSSTDRRDVEYRPRETARGVLRGNRTANCY